MNRPGSNKKTSVKSEITCSCDGRYQQEPCNPTAISETSNLNTPSNGMTMCEEAELGYKATAAGFKAAGFDAATLNEVLQTAAAVCKPAEICGRPCREDSKINVPTNSVGSNSVDSMTACEEAELGYKATAAGFKTAGFDASTLNEMLQIAAAVCEPVEICGRPCRESSETANNQVSSFDPVQDIVMGSNNI